MDAASNTPPQQTKTATKIRHLPAEIVEEILLNLPVKSLLRYSSVSKSWNSMIFGSLFIKRYRCRAALPGRERIVFNPDFVDHDNRFFFCPLTDILSDNPIEDATDLVCPFKQLTWKDHGDWGVNIPAFCDELWCVENKQNRSLFLWNPTMRTHRKLPNSSQFKFNKNSFFYGLGYDSVGDDYKIVKIHDGRYEHETELYSLRSNSWRKIQPFPEIRKKDHLSEFSSFVSGALHWLVRHHDRIFIICFDLSTEKYGEVTLPNYGATPDLVEVVVARGKLCLCLSYRATSDMTTSSFALWVMEDYGVVESWTKKFDIDCNTVPRICEESFFWRPLYFCDNGQSVIAVSMDSNEKSSGIYMYKDDKTLVPSWIPEQWRPLHPTDDMIVMKKCGRFSNVHVESLVSPAKWPMPAAAVAKSET